MKYLLAVLLSTICIPLIASELSKSDLAKWEKIKIEVASIRGVGGKFHRSLRGFKRNNTQYDEEYELIKGDLNHNISDMRLIHVIGNLNAKLTLEDHSEVVIMGDVSKDSVIYINSMSNVFIGGSLYGSIVSSDSAYIYIIGSVKGTITTGSPSTELEVNGDFSGDLKPNDKEGSLASITVHGFTDINKIKEIFSYKYSVLKAAFHNSNAKPGIYHSPVPNTKYYTVINEAY